MAGRVITVVSSQLISGAAFRIALADGEEDGRRRGQGDQAWPTSPGPLGTRG